MNIKPPHKKDETYRKYKYLIWRDDVGFMHLESFSLEELKSFSASISKEMEKFLSEEIKESVIINE
jgi:hypothetical protein